MAGGGGHLLMCDKSSRTGKEWRERKRAGLWFPSDAVCHPILSGEQ